MLELFCLDSKSEWYTPMTCKHTTLFSYIYTQVSLLAAYIGLLRRASTAWEQIQKYQADEEKPRLRMDGKALGHNLDS